MIKEIRDLVFIDIDDKKSMVIACDSCGSIGDKPSDVFKVDPFITGKYTARVAMLEVLSTGAEIKTIIDNVCCEMNPTGEKIIEGIKSELKILNSKDIALTGSTEENFPTSMTALGITIIGIVDKEKLKVNNIKKEAQIYVVGIPKVGNEIKLPDDEIFSYDNLKYLQSYDKVYEFVIGGSKGILYEAKELAKNNKKDFYLKENLKVNINKSCGPATACIVAIDKEIEHIMNNIKNAEKIGVIK